ncbi:MAG TPA: LCP family protein [Candidatus Paceibacterota bacterium]
MDPILNNNLNPIIQNHTKKPWHKRPLFYFLVTAILIGCYYGYQFSLAYNTISVDNSSWWDGVANIFDKRQDESKPDPYPMPEKESDRLDILILGLRGEDNAAIEGEGGLLTDTMIIASIDEVTKKTALVSIPRDLYVDIEIKTPASKNIRIKGKINSVYERGLEGSNGIAIAKEVLSRLTGVYIDKAVVFDFDAFNEIVNNIGGIDIRLAKPFEEKNQWGYEFSLPAGDNHLQGDQALYYVRSRYSTSDFDRARRQQEVIAAIKTKALSLGFLSNPNKVTGLLSDLKNHIRTDFQLWDIKDMVTLASGFGGKTGTKNYVITTDNLVYETKTEKGEYILLPKEGNYDAIQKLLSEILIN